MSTPGSSGADSGSGSDGGGQRDRKKVPEKVLKRRERNKEAAQRCREKKIERLFLLEFEVFDLQDQNAELIRDGARKDAENARLKSEIHRLQAELAQLASDTAHLTNEAHRFYGETEQLRKELAHRAADNEQLNHELTWANGSKERYCSHCFALQ